MVKGQESKDWWRVKFVHHAREIRHKIITFASTLDGDAPVAHSIAEHPSVVMRVPTAVQVTHGSMFGLRSRPPQQSAAKRRKIDAHHGSPPDIRGNPPNQGGSQPPSVLPASTPLRRKEASRYVNCITGANAMVPLEPALAGRIRAPTPIAYTRVTSVAPPGTLAVTAVNGLRAPARNTHSEPQHLRAPRAGPARARAAAAAVAVD